MKKLTNIGLLFVIVLLSQAAKAQLTDTEKYDEKYRLQTHFSPKAHWINDPNGMFYFNHTYHLFYQYYPGGNGWGPMHWGHAISKDLVHWKELPIALYPDSLGFIFSGSAVVDSNNTSGFGKNGKPPLVAIFTHHDPKREQAGKDNFQNQSLAYSLDEGYTWTKYSGNPVLKNPGIRDFRDPKVCWFAPEHKWIMTLATKDRVTFYSSPNLKDWTRESEFGEKTGAHGGVWECPDLFSLALQGRRYWILTANLNPGGPNGGSATQYFVGEFNGTTFTPLDNKTRWVDYGPDEYAGVTWSNTGSRVIFLGWMSNWAYAGQLPTEKWRNAMSVPRQLSLQRVGGELLLRSTWVKEFGMIEQKPIPLVGKFLTGKIKVGMPPQYLLKLKTKTSQNYTVTFFNDNNEKIVFGYDCSSNRYYLDRKNSGKIDFNPDFGRIAYAPKFSNAKESRVEILIDASSIEVLADNGLTVMTSLYFPGKSLNELKIEGQKGVISSLIVVPLRSIWQK